MTKVLIIEDETMLSDVYSMVLTMNGFTVAVAGNGIIGLEKASQFAPDIILLDLLMPKMDGLTFLKTYERSQDNPAKIIVYSNLFDSKKEEEVKLLGAEGIILKSSVTPDGLVQLINDYAFQGSTN